MEFGYDFAKNAVIFGKESSSSSDTFHELEP